MAEQPAGGSEAPPRRLPRPVLLLIGVLAAWAVAAGIVVDAARPGRRHPPARFPFSACSPP